MKVEVGNGPVGEEEEEEDMEEGGTPAGEGEGEEDDEDIGDVEGNIIVLFSVNLLVFPAIFFSIHIRLFQILGELHM